MSLLVDINENANRRLSSEKEVMDWLIANTNVLVSMKIHPDLSVDIAGSLLIFKSHGLTELPVKFNMVSKNFSLESGNIRTMKNFPKYVGGSLDIGGNPISSFEHAPSHIAEDIFMEETNITSFHNIHKHIKRIGTNNSGGIKCSITACKNLLSLFFIEDLEEIVGLAPVWTDPRTGFVRRKMDSNFQKNENALEIVNKHLRGDRDVHACQEELLEAGFRAAARF